MRSKLVILLAAMILALGVTSAFAHNEFQGAVYVASNAADGNSVLVFSRAINGKLSPRGVFSTGGQGTGAGLGNQGGLILSEDGEWLFVVNAGSNEISAFSVRSNGLKWTDKVPSGGKHPISLTFDGDVLYVLNAGGAVSDQDNITGFVLTRNGKLLSLPNSTRPLSGPNTGPAQVSFSPRGGLLVVTEKNTNSLDVFTVEKDGTATGPLVQPSSGTTPFGFSFGRSNKLFVSEAFGGAADASALSSYRLHRDGMLESLSPSAPTTETAACWAVVTSDERFAYVTNTGSGSISGYAIGPRGRLKLLDPDGQTALPGAAPIDAAIASHDRFLYTLNSGSHTITGFRIGFRGDLTPVTVVPGLPASANGLAAR
jgi:6-phosphogluconolactonase (cycloisomerase 2 family)